MSANPPITLPLHIVKTSRGDLEVFDAVGVALMYFDCAEMPLGAEMAEFLVGRVNAQPAPAVPINTELVEALRKVTERCMSREHPSAREQGVQIATDSEMADALYESRALLARIDAQPKNEKDRLANELVQSWVDNGDAQPGPAPSAERLQFLYDVLTTIAEGGRNYWAVGRNAKRDGDLNWLSFDLRDAEDDKAEWHHVDITTIERGIAAILSGKATVSKNIIGQIASGNARNDGGDIDADAADCIIQVGIFGRIVFG